MPNQLKAGHVRMTYVESLPIRRAFSLMAAAKNVTVSDLVREATQRYLKAEDPSGEFTKLARSLALNSSDDRTERATETLSPEDAEKIARLFKKFR
jgi:hypothetical protein